MAASIARMRLVSALFIRGCNIAFSLFRRSSNGRFSLITDITRSQNITRLTAVPVRRWSAQEADTSDSPDESPKPDQLSDDDIAAGIAYLQSEEYKEKYGSRPVFANYRRNHKGGVPPKKTRKICVRGKGETLRVAGNPCPICRDSELVLHHTNVKLLEQFICPESGEIYSDARTGLCQKQYKKLLKVIAGAKAAGLIPFPVPFVYYNYEEYYGKNTTEAKTS